MRAYPDSTRVTFDTQGLMTRVTDRFGSATVIVYDGAARVWKVQDPTHIAQLPRELTLTYDANGLSSIQDPFQRTTQVWVDGSRDLRTVTDPDGVASQFTYSGGRLATVRDRRGAITALGYHAQAGKVTSVTAPAVTIFGEGQVQPVRTFAPWQTVGVPYAATSGSPFVTLRADSVRGSVTDAGGHTSAFSVNALGQPLRATGLLGDTVTVTYDSRGLPTQIADRLGVTASFAYDGAGFLTQSVVSGVVMNFRNGGWGRPDSVWGQGSAQRLFLNAANGRVDSTRAGGAVTRFTYDEVGRLTIARDHVNHLLVQRLYNDWGVWRDTLPSGVVSTYGYDGFGRLRTVASTGQPTDSVDYDIMNRPVRTFDGVNANPTVLGYDSLLLTSVTDPRGQVYQFTYNALGWPTARTDPALATETAEYDRDGLIRRTTNRRGQAADMTYDELHRRRIRSGSAMSADTLSYSSDGRHVTAANAAARETAFLNARLQPDSVRTVLTIPGGSPQTYVQRYNYTGEGWLQSTWVTGAITSQTRQYAWRPNVGILDSLRFGASPWTRFSFTPELLAAVTRFSGTDSITRSFVEGHARQTLSTPGVYEDYGYDAQSRLTLARVGTMGRRSTFGYDGLGRLSATTFLPPTTGCGFNPQTGLVCTGGTPDSTHAFSYDPVGNRLDHGGNYTSTGNRITAFDTCTYGADGDGEVTTRSCPGQGATLTWSGDGRLTSYTVNGTTVGFSYDAAGRLVRRDVNGAAQRYFLWDGPSLVAELGAGGTSLVAEYAYYPGGLDNLYALAVGGATYFAKADAMGNVRALTDGNGTVRRYYNYDEWGRLASTSADYVPLNDADRARWKGALWMGPELDIYYMRNRWYEPHTGRFLSEDPIGLAGGINPYVFAGDDPINGSDPYGLQGCSVAQASPQGRCPIQMSPLSVWAEGTGPEGCYLEALRPPGLGNGVVCFGSFVIGGFSTPTLDAGSLGGVIGDGAAGAIASSRTERQLEASGVQDREAYGARYAACIATTPGIEAAAALSILPFGNMKLGQGFRLPGASAFTSIDRRFPWLPGASTNAGVRVRTVGSGAVKTAGRYGTVAAVVGTFAASYAGTTIVRCMIEARNP